MAKYDEGKYDADAAALLRKYHPAADNVLVIVGGADPGFSLATTSPRSVRRLTKVLRCVIEQIEKQTAQQAAQQGWKIEKF
jgi:hypothetical protein